MRWYVGVPMSGKSTLSLYHAAQLKRATGFPLLALDSQPAKQLAGVPHVATVDEAIASVWGRPRRSCAIIPQSLDEVDALCAAVSAGKDVVLLVDEAHRWLSAQSGSSAALLQVMRATQHARCHALLTTQHLTGDVPQAALSCAPQLYIFRCSGPRVLRTLQSEFGIPPRVAARLPQHEFIAHRLGF